MAKKSRKFGEATVYVMLMDTQGEFESEEITLNEYRKRERKGSWPMGIDPIYVACPEYMTDDQKQAVKNFDPEKLFNLVFDPKNHQELIDDHGEEDFKRALANKTFFGSDDEGFLFDLKKAKQDVEHFESNPYVIGDLLWQMIDAEKLVMDISHNNQEADQIVQKFLKPFELYTSGDKHLIESKFNNLCNKILKS